MVSLICDGSFTSVFPGELELGPASNRLGEELARARGEDGGGVNSIDGQDGALSDTLISAPDFNAIDVAIISRKETLRCRGI